MAPALRPARPEDHAAILAFWNPLIRDTTVTFSSEEKTSESLAAMIAARRAAGHEFLVAEDAGAVFGFATYAQFRGGNGYATAMEHTIILAEAARGRGVGRALIEAIAGHAAEAGAHTLMAGVSAENSGGIAFHRSVGFRTVAVVPEVGRKFGRYIDLVLMQRVLATADKARGGG